MVNGLKIKIFADGADLSALREAADNPAISGFTTNPTLMHSAGVTDYKAFAIEALSLIGERPISLEVFADDFPTMERQARELASWGDNVYVKIPVTDTKGAFSGPLISRLSHDGVKVNVTAVFTTDQVLRITEALCPDTPSIISVFAGRIADTGRDPTATVQTAVWLCGSLPKTQLLWASTREVLSVYDANAVGCDIITLTAEQIKKLSLYGKHLETYSRETVEMFYNDARIAGYVIPLGE